MRDDDGTTPQAEAFAGAERSPDADDDATAASAPSLGAAPAPDVEAPVEAPATAEGDEIDALTSALDDAFEETFGGGDARGPGEAYGGDPLETAAASLSASARAIGGTDQMLRETRHMLDAARHAMDESRHPREKTARPSSRPRATEPAAPAPDARGPMPDAAHDVARDAAHVPDDAEGEDTPDADRSAEADDRARIAAARAALLTERATETVDLEDADDDPVGDPPSRPPDSLLGAIRWDDDAHPGPLRIAVAGGRGGAGRTLLVANAALVLARLGRRCSVVDLDPVGAGLHTALGLPPLLPGPAELLDPPPVEAEPVAGVPLHLLRPRRPTSSGPADPLRAECLAAARERDDDVLVLDLGAQCDPFTLDNWLEADVSVVLAEPLPSAIERAYGFLRAALWRRLLHGRGEIGHGPTAVARRVIAERPEIDSPEGLVAALSEVDADAARAIRARVLTFTPRLVMNRTRNRVDREMGPAMISALRRRWGVAGEFVGAIDFDEAVREAARRRRPLLLAYPGAGYSQAIEKVARHLDRLAGRAVTR